MKTIYEFCQSDSGPLILAIGIFDGVHTGHRTVLNEARAQARKCDGQAWALTFDPFPLEIIAPERAPQRLMSLPDKLATFEALGMDGCMVLHFSEKLRRMTPEDFLLWLKKELPRLSHIVVGSNWHFGFGHSGSAATLKLLASPCSVGVSIVQPVMVGGEPVSSTRLRSALKTGNWKLVADLLGHRYVVNGSVVHGREIGRTLGFPTANVKLNVPLDIPFGVYAVDVSVGGNTWHAAAYFGKRPTFDNGNPVLEVYILNQHMDLYHCDMSIAFASFIRADCTFDSPEALMRQIQSDVVQVQAFHAASGVSG